MRPLLWLRIFALLSLLMLLLAFLSFPQTDCNACKVKIAGKEVGIRGFMEKYFRDCVEITDNLIYMKNITINGTKIT